MKRTTDEWDKYIRDRMVSLGTETEKALVLAREIGAAFEARRTKHAPIRAAVSADEIITDQICALMTLLSQLFDSTADQIGGISGGDVRRQIVEECQARIASIWELLPEEGG